VRLTPEEIEARRFRLAPNGYDCEAVDRFLAEITDALREQPVPATGTDEFSRVGQEIAAVLRSARDSAAAVRAEAEGQAAAARSRAEAEAADLRKEAKAHLHDAEQTLAEARVRAERIVGDAERHADEIRHAERVARQRLLATRTDLQHMIDRLGGSSDASVLDLTADDADATLGDPAATTPAGTPAHRADPLATGGPGAEVGAPVEAPDHPSVPLLRMVRAAVGRAAEHSEADTARDDAVELETEIPAV
jgi:DivIVA domain-containing protein